MKASFVIVNYNRKDELLLTLSKTRELIRESESDFEIVVVDNASTDNSAEEVKLKFSEVLLIQNEINAGAPAWNIGFEKAGGDYFIILDDDSHIEYGLDDALKFLDENEKVGILALNIVGGAYQTIEWADMSERAGFIGCGAIFRKSVYDKIGGYPEWMFLYSNEWDLGLRTLLSGYKIIHFKKCQVRHRASTVNRTSKRLIVFSVKHELALIYKYYSRKRWKYLFRIFINNLKRVKGDGLIAASYVIKGGIKFLKMRKNIKCTPVPADVQNFFTKKFASTQSIFTSNAKKNRQIQ